VLLLDGANTSGAADLTSVYEELDSRVGLTAIGLLVAGGTLPMLWFNRSP
jgi:hypothetical protein